MTFDSAVQHRRSIRLQRYDYSSAGAYFVTICTQNRECLFGEMVDGAMRLNEAGKVVEQCWQEIFTHFPHVELDEFVVMPNHVHGILVIGDFVLAAPLERSDLLSADSKLASQNGCDKPTQSMKYGSAITGKISSATKRNWRTSALISAIIRPAGNWINCIPPQVQPPMSQSCPCVIF